MPKKKTTRPTPRIPPLALVELHNHPLALALPAAPFGMLCRLLFHFALTDCKPIPQNDTDIRHLCRAHRSSWAIHRKDVLAVFRDVAPDIEAAHQHHKRRLELVKELGQRGNATRRLRAMANKPPRPDPAPTVTPTTPKRAPVTPTAQPLPAESAWR